MFASPTPYNEASFLADLELDLISNTCCSVNLELGTLEPIACLLRSVLSLALSDLLPDFRCAGFTHLGLSH